jgi:hypothetical protein
LVTIHASQSNFMHGYTLCKDHYERTTIRPNAPGMYCLDHLQKWRHCSRSLESPMVLVTRLTLEGTHVTARLSFMWGVTWYHLCGNVQMCAGMRSVCRQQFTVETNHQCLLCFRLCSNGEPAGLIATAARMQATHPPSLRHP